MNIDQEIDKLLEREGDFVDNPDDAGGPTKYGINQHILQMWLARGVTVDDVKNLNKRTAREIYYSWYFIKPGFSQLPMLIQPIMLDTGVNMGQKRAIKILQDALFCHGIDCGPIDGKIGDRTIAAAFAGIEKMGNGLITAIVNRRVIAYENSVKLNETQRKFLSGWIARAESFRPA